jgi:hypothetical protein
VERQNNGYFSQQKITLLALDTGKTFIPPLVTAVNGLSTRSLPIHVAAVPPDSLQAYGPLYEWMGWAEKDIPTDQWIWLFAGIALAAGILLAMIIFGIGRPSSKLANPAHPQAWWKALNTLEQQWSSEKISAPEAAAQWLMLLKGWMGLQGMEKPGLTSREMWVQASHMVSQPEAFKITSCIDLCYATLFGKYRPSSTEIRQAIQALQQLAETQTTRHESPFQNT